MIYCYIFRNTYLTTAVKLNSAHTPMLQSLVVHLCLQTGFPVYVCWRVYISGIPFSGPSCMPGTCTGSEETKPGTAATHSSTMFNWAPWLCFLPSLFKMSRKDEPSQKHRSCSFLLSPCCCNVLSAGVEHS